MGTVPQDTDGSPALDDPLNPTPASDPPPIPGGSSPGEPAGASPPGAPEREPANGRAAGASQGPADRGPAEPPPPPPPPPEAPGLGEQIGATRDSAKRLIDAHVELAKAELADIGDAAKRAAALIGLALGTVLVAALIVIVGMPLFLGEAIFGSMGWGILLGVLFLAAVALAAVIAALRPATGTSIGRPFVVGLLVGIVVGVVLGLDLTNRAWSNLAEAVVPGVDAAYRPLLTAVVGLAIAGAVLGLIAGARAAGGAAGGLIFGAIVGVLLGFLTAFAPGPRVGAAIGVAAGLITWIALLGAGIARGGIDGDALKDRFWPARTIEATKETIEWARERMPLSRRS